MADKMDSDKQVFELLENGVYHNYFGPAVVYPDGTQYWYTHGMLHRTDGPAVVMADGTLYWYKLGKLHRRDGPAVLSESRSEWYVDGEQCSTPADYQAKANLTNEQMLKLFMLFGKLM